MTYMQLPSAIIFLVAVTFVGIGSVARGEMRAGATFSSAVSPEENASAIAEAKRSAKSVLQTVPGKLAYAAAYKELFGEQPGAKFRAPCDLQKRYSGRKLKLTLDHEWHGQLTAQHYQRKLFERSDRGEIIILSESDMALPDGASKSEANIVHNGLTRTRKSNFLYDLFSRMNDTPAEPKNTFGIDDGRVRAYSVNSNLSDAEILEEIFRNPVLRKFVTTVPGFEKSKLRTALAVLDRDPKFQFEDLDIGFGFKQDVFWKNFFSSRSRLYPATEKLRQTSVELSYELRDESMSRAVGDFLCRRTDSIDEIHVVIGSFHVEGMKSRLTQALAGSDFEIQINDMMQDRSTIPAPRAVGGKKISQ